MKNCVQSFLAEGSLKSTTCLVFTAESIAGDFKQQIEIRDELLNWLKERKLLNHEPFIFVGPKWALQYFVARTMIYTINGASENNESVTFLWLLDILRNLEPSSNPLLAMTEARRLLELTEKFGVRKRLAFNRHFLPLSFLFIPYGHKRNNGLFAPGLNYIIVLRMKRCDKNNASYVFLHEIGHAFQYHSTGDVDIVPESFMEATKDMFSSPPEEDWPEIYADCFSVAAMYGTEYARRNPFHRIFATKHQELLVEYPKGEFPSAIPKLSSGIESGLVKHTFGKGGDHYKPS